MRSVFKYFGEVKSELGFVTWPKPKEVIKLTVIVIMISLIIGGYVGGLDFGFTKLLSIVITK